MLAFKMQLMHITKTKYTIFYMHSKTKYLILLSYLIATFFTVTTNYSQTIHKADIKKFVGKVLVSNDNRDLPIKVFYDYRIIDTDNNSNDMTFEKISNDWRNFILTVGLPNYIADKLFIKNIETDDYTRSITLRR
jgi:hypothetical protein